MPENKGISAGILVGGLALFVCSLSLWVQLLHERDHDGTNYMPVVMSIILYVTSLGLVAWAVYINIRDANRAKYLRGEIVTIKDDARIQIETLEKGFVGMPYPQPYANPPWAGYKSEDDWRASIAEQNRLIELGRSTDGLFTPIQIEILRLRRSIVAWFSDLPDRPVMDMTGLEVDNADRRTAASNRKIFEWSERIRHAYAIEFAPKVVEIAHKLGLDGLDVRVLEARSSSAGTPDEVSEIIIELGNLALQAEGRVE